MPNIKELAARLLAQDRRALSKAITLLESNNENDRRQALALLDIIMPHSGRALRIGISGSPGVGKSTFINAFGQQLIDSGKRIAALTIDPSSKITGGSILGDKTRMSNLATNDNAFIRPSPSGCILGGMARRSQEVIALCEAAGFDTILLETVGVGQSETDVASMVDCYFLMIQPASGDALQGIKRGIMELADFIIVNKADGDLLASARRSAAHYLQAMTLMPSKTPDWQRPVILCSSIENSGIDDIQKNLNEYVKQSKQSGYFEQNRKNQLYEWLRSETRATLQDSFDNNSEIQTRFAQLKRPLEAGQSPARLAKGFVQSLLDGSIK